MAEKEIKVIIGGDATPLRKALNQLNAPIKKAESELRKINRGLKIDPGNITLLKQRFDVLTQEMSDTKRKADALRQSLKQADADGVDKTSQAYRELQRELIDTEVKLKRVTAEQAQASMRANKFGSAIGNLQKVQPTLNKVGNSFMRITKAAAGISTALVGISVHKAFKKLESLAETESVFKAIGVEGKKLSDVMTDVSGAVSGTKYTLADMAKIAKGAYTSIESEGIAMGDYLGRVSDLAAFTGQSVSTMGTLMNKALAKGKVDMRLMNSLMANGLPIMDDLASAYGKSKEEIAKMVSAGKIGIKEIMQATAKYGGVATKTAMSTVSGAVTILGQRWTSAGAAFLQGAYEPIKGGLISLADKLGAMLPTIQKWGASFGEGIRALVEIAKYGDSELILTGIGAKMAAVLGPLVRVIKGLVDAFNQLSPTMKKVIVISLLAIGPVLKLTSSLITAGNAVLTLAGKGKVLFGAMKAGTGIFGKLGPNILKLAGPIGIAVAGFIALMKNSEAFRNAVVSLFKVIGTTLLTVFKALAPLLKVIGDLFNTVASALGDALGPILSTLIPILEKWLGLLASIITVIAKVVTVVISKVAGFVTKLVNLFKHPIKSMRGFGRNLIEGLWNGIKDKGEWIRNKIKGFVDNVKKWFKKFFGIKSPSKLMRDEVGKWIPAGIAVGIDKNLGVLKQSMNNMAQTVATPLASNTISNNSIASAISGAISTGESTIVVQLDGKTIAQGTAPYMQNALTTLTTRNNRKLGIV